MIRDKRVAVGWVESPTSGSAYPKAPFDPPAIFPEWRAAGLAAQTINSENTVYPALRSLLAAQGLDEEHFGTPEWNPFAGLVNCGEHVVIKPNLVYHEHPHGKEGVEAMITHASIVRPLIDYLLLATSGDVRITICDVPLQNADWQDLIAHSGFAALCEYYRQKGTVVELLDLRYEITAKNRSGVTSIRRRAQGDPRGYAIVDLGRDSCLAPVADQCNRLEITDYGKGTVARHHNHERNEYFVCKTVLDSDLIINVPKMKCHRKAGVTLSLKNLVGINGDKSWIAHHRRGVDEYPAFDLRSYLKWYVSYYLKLYAPTPVVSAVYRLYRNLFLGGKSIKQHSMQQGGVLMEGNWHGNDTVWRSIVDLNRIILYCDKSGQMKDSEQRRTLSIVDGVIGMDREGPMDGLPRASGVLVGGGNFAAVDYVASHLMGFSPEKIPQIVNAFAESPYPLASFLASEVDVVYTGEQAWHAINFGYQPSKGWAAYLEREPCINH